MAVTGPPHLMPRTFFGLRTDIQYNAHYLNETELLYPAGCVLVVHNHYQNSQKFIKLTDKHKVIKALILSPNRRWLAISEIAEEGEKPTIAIYDMQTFKKRKSLTVPFENSAREFADMQFSFDSKYLVAITGEPDWYLYYYNWDKGKVESHAKAQNQNGTGSITSVQCNPADNTLVVITGPQTFRIMNVSETVWRQWGWCKSENIVVTSCIWLNQDRIMFGTSAGNLYVIENGDLKHIYVATEVIEISLKKLADDADDDKSSTESKEDSQDEQVENEESEVYPVTNLINFTKGFAFACGHGYVHMFEKETIHRWRKRNVFRIWKKAYKHTREFPDWSPLDAIQHITVDPNEEVFVISTLRTQFYQVNLFGQHMLQAPEITFRELGAAMHFGGIRAMSMCAWKPIFLTVGDDRSLRIWNYVTDTVEMIKIYQEEIHATSLHPSGLFCIVGFSDKLRFLVILIDDFEVMREFPIRNCKQCRFSNNGHLFAAVNGSVIQVFSSISFCNVLNLKGHNGQVTGISWAATDLVLVSCGTEGAVYEWSMNTGHRVGEVIIKTNQFQACASNAHGKITYAVGTDGLVREIGDSVVRRYVTLLGIPLDTLALSRSDMMLFTTGGEGTLAGVQVPLLDKAIFSEYHMHNKKIVGIFLSYDDQTLISVANDSSICIWKLTNADGRAVSLDKDFAYSKEILISKRDLEEKINNMNLLSTRISELETEHTYQLRQTEATHAEKMKEVHEGYCAAIEELKDKIEQMENEHTHEIGMIQQDITKMRSGHERTLQNIEADFNAKLIGEYDKYQTLEDKTARLRKDYEQKLEDLAKSKRMALREMSEKYEGKLEEKEFMIADLQEQADLEKKEHEAIKTAIEDDADREIIEVKTGYEAQLKEEKDANVRLKGETSLMKKKLISAFKDIDDFKHHITQLKSEHKQFQKVIGNLEKDVTDLKKEISERDTSIQDKEKRIYELKRKNQELEKYKFVLNFKITELKNQIEPKQKELEELAVQIGDMENEENKLFNIKHNLDRADGADYQRKKISNPRFGGVFGNSIDKKNLSWLGQVGEKLSSVKKDLTAEAEKNLAMKGTLKKIKIDLYSMTSYLQDPHRLKNSVRVLFQKYVEDKEFMRSRAADEEASMEFNRQRDHLEKQIAGLKAQLVKSLGGSKGEVAKIMEENCTLLSEINSLRMELKKTRTRCSQMESILGLSTRYMPPAIAQAKLKHVTEDRERLDESYSAMLQERDELILALKNENERLLNMIKCPEEKTRLRLLSRKDSHLL